MLGLLFIIIWKEVTDAGQFMNVTDFTVSHQSKLKCSVGNPLPASLQHATSYSFKNTVSTSVHSW